MPKIMHKGSHRTVAGTITACIRACVDAGIVRDVVALSARLQREAIDSKVGVGSVNDTSSLPTNAVAAIVALFMAAKSSKIGNVTKI